MGVVTGSEFEPRRPHTPCSVAMLFSWIALAKIQPDAYLSIRSNDFIEISRNPGFLKPLGIISERAYRPWLVTPRIDVWLEIERRINRDLTGRARGRGPVLQLADPDSGVERTFSFVTRFYRPNIVVIEVHLRTALDVSLREAFHHRPLSQHKAAYAATDSLVGIIASGSTRGYSRNNAFFSRPAMALPIDVPDDEFIAWRDRNKPIIANLLINNTNYDFAAPELSDTIFARNKNTDIKFAQAAFSLVSKQGIVTAYSNIPYVAKSLLKEHKKRLRFLEFSLAFREFLSEFSNIRQHNEDIADFLFYLGRPLISEAAILPQTMTGTYVWRILSDELGFDIVMERIETRVLEKIDAKSEYFMRMPHHEYDSLDFAEKLRTTMRPFQRNWLERSYHRHKAIFWIMGATIAAAGVVVQVLIG